MFLLFWAGIAFFVATLGSHRNQSDLFVAKNGIGVVEIKGVITDAKDVLAQLVKFRQSAHVKGVVVRIDSPGGAVGASQEVFREIERTNTFKPVVASMGSVAASGGYYAALGAGKIFANPGTLTGSMGVILKFPNLEEIFEKIGYKDQVVKSGKLKDIGSPNRSLTTEERELLQSLIDVVHEQFIADISRSRNLPVEDVRPMADGRIFSGEQAQELGLVDDLGNFNDAVAFVAKLSGMETDTPKLIYPEENQFAFLKILAEQKLALLLRNLVSETKPVLSFEWDI
ncbi:MAG: signal peptide peptidase SppA [Desulfobulbaceae bacterium]|nr:signal peptide peptidase SppA [Desulfobulbaceae bacterium]